MTPKMKMLILYYYSSMISVSDFINYIYPVYLFRAFRNSLVCYRTAEEGDWHLGIQ